VKETIMLLVQDYFPFNGITVFLNERGKGTHTNLIMQDSYENK